VELADVKLRSEFFGGVRPKLFELELADFISGAPGPGHTMYRSISTMMSCSLLLESK